MSTETTAALYLMFMVGLIGVGAAICGFRAYLRDSFRQKAFTIRNELFDWAADGNISFNDPAYWRLRLMMNGTIRFTHRLSLGELILPVCLYLARRKEPQLPLYSVWIESVLRHPDHVRRDLMKFHERFCEEMARHILRYSPLAGPLIAVSMLFQRATRHRPERPRVQLVHCGPIVEERALLSDPEWLSQQGSRVVAA